MKKKIICNVCGKELVMEKEILKEGVFSVEQEWDYFSNKDLQIHKFVICEQCYDEWIKTFKHPVEVIKKREVL